MTQISSWNVWGIPFASWRLFGRQLEWRKWCNEVFHGFATQEQHACGNDELIIACFQEAWAWRCGPCWPLCFGLGRLQKWTRWGLAPVGCIIQVLCFLTGWLLPWILWDTKHGLRLRCTSKAKDFPLEHAVGHKGDSISGTFKMMDSGLLILSNREVRNQASLVRKTSHNAFQLC